MKIEPRISVAQLADMWGVSRQHVYNLVTTGELPTVRIGSLIRIRPEDLLEYENRKCRDHASNNRNSPSSVGERATTSSGGRMESHAGFHAARKSLTRRDAS